MTRADQGGCQVAGCDDVATGSYLHAGHGDAIEFGVCARHVAMLQAGTRPAVHVEHQDDGRRRATLVVE